MRKSKKKSQVNAQETMDKIRAIARHIRNVQDNCLLLGEKLIANGELELGKQLIANGFEHDLSKFRGIEFEFMAPGTLSEEEGAKLKLKLAIQQHNTTNKHHPENWAKAINDMPDVFLAEMVCDWKSRSEEFGTALRDWIDITATKKWNFVKNDEIYERVMKYVDMVCEKPFTESN
jgi:hypothetical protein